MRKHRFVFFVCCLLVLVAGSMLDDALKAESGGFEDLVVQVLDPDDCGGKVEAIQSDASWVEVSDSESVYIAPERGVEVWTEKYYYYYTVIPGQCYRWIVRLPDLTTYKRSQVPLSPSTDLTVPKGDRDGLVHRVIFYEKKPGELSESEIIYLVENGDIGTALLSEDKAFPQIPTNESACKPAGGICKTSAECCSGLICGVVGGYHVCH